MSTQQLNNPSTPDDSVASQQEALAGASLAQVF